MRARLAAAAATMPAPTTFHDQAGLASSGLAAISASTVAATAACSVGSLVSVPAGAAVMTAPTPAQNHAPPWISGYTDTDARMTAAAAVRVSLGFIRRLPASPDGGPAGRPGWAGRGEANRSAGGRAGTWPGAARRPRAAWRRRGRPPASLPRGGFPRAHLARPAPPGPGPLAPR